MASFLRFVIYVPNILRMPYNLLIYTIKWYISLSIGMYCTLKWYNIYFIHYPNLIKMPNYPIFIFKHEQLCRRQYESLLSYFEKVGPSASWGNVPELIREHLPIMKRIGIQWCVPKGWLCQEALPVSSSYGAVYSVTCSF